MRRSFVFACTLLTLLWLLVAIGCQQVSPHTFWPALFGALTLPVALGLNLLLAGYWLLRNWRVALLPLAAAALTWPHFERGLALNPGAAVAAGAPADTTARVRLLSANVRIFNVYPQLRDPDLASSRALIAWLAQSPADVICLQEFYNEPVGIRTRDGDAFQSVAQIGPRAGRQYFFSRTLTNGMGAEFGLAIFSRYPILRRGTISFGKKKLTQNHAMYADLRLPTGDTVRVFNFHLQSMSLEEQDIVDSYSSRTGFERKGRGLLARFKRGSVVRSIQIDTLTRRFAQCRYPLLLGADLNDLPYSYSYAQLANRFQNAWASVGNGVGATYNGRLLPFVRIDNQFASDEWQVKACQVRRDIPYSDHFPLLAEYELQTIRPVAAGK